MNKDFIELTDEVESGGKKIPIKSSCINCLQWIPPCNYTLVIFDGGECRVLETPEEIMSMIEAKSDYYSEWTATTHQQ